MVFGSAGWRPLTPDGVKPVVFCALNTRKRLRYCMADSVTTTFAGKQREK